MKYTIIINPAAGKGCSINEQQQITDFFINKGQATVFVTQKIEDIEQYIKSTQETTDQYVFVGGDGTFRAAIKYCYQHNISQPIALLAHGSGNDFIKAIGIPQKLSQSLDNAIATHYINVKHCNVNDDIFINITSVGLDAEIAQLQKKLKKHFRGPLSYLLASFIKLITYRAQTYQLTIDNRQVNDKYLLIAVANGQYYGGGMKIAPAASPLDEQLTVCCVKHVSPLILPFLIPLLYLGRHTKLWCVDYFKCEKIEITNHNNMLVNLDGEIDSLKKLNIHKNNHYHTKIRLLK